MPWRMSGATFGKGAAGGAAVGGALPSARAPKLRPNGWSRIPRPSVPAGAGTTRVAELVHPFSQYRDARAGFGDDAKSPAPRSQFAPWD